MEYLLITPAKNEERFIPQLIDSVSNQDIRPALWIIVSDGSSDRTAELIVDAASKHCWIRAVVIPSGAQRGFGAKALAYKSAIDAAGTLSPYSFIGNLDADITFPPHYYSTLIERMRLQPRLGVASGVCWDKIGEGFKCVTISQDHAVGAVQFFRKECYQAIGGYQPVTIGGVDSLAELKAKMLGWIVRCFSDLPVYHHKPVDSAGGRPTASIAFRAGLTEYHIGSHPLFALAKALRRWKNPPAGISVIWRMAGYCSLWARRVPRDADDALVKYLHAEQRRLLKQTIMSRHKRLD